MQTYRCKRYRRSAPGQNSGIVIDELTFQAASAIEAEDKIRRNFCSPLFGAMDWEKDFVTLEDDSGTALVTWLHGMLHA
jgi:hypothetical protein